MKSLMNGKSFRSGVIALLIMVLAASTVFAQPGMGRMKKKGFRNMDRESLCMRLPDLTEGQEEQIEKMKTDFFSEITPVKNQLDIKKAELKALSTGDEVDLKKINAKIDEITDLQGDVMKKHAAHRQKIREILNEKQKMMFDQHAQRFGTGMHQGFNRPGPGPKGFRGPHPDCPYWEKDDD
ncbi:MAG: Spy/CpxP family protein refolding chaperone [Bacteroidales bacterium]|nr:Spy/CpxP family protein refolding chaperone [Bacteroidales bacterium]MCF8396726.1 Spy/CpxP family protein refolding chaperone [Bacteroidales bacterium]